MDQAEIHLVNIYERIDPEEGYLLEFLFSGFRSATVRKIHEGRARGARWLVKFPAGFPARHFVAAKKLIQDHLYPLDQNCSLMIS